MHRRDDRRLRGSVLLSVRRAALLRTGVREGAMDDGKKVLRVREEKEDDQEEEEQRSEDEIGAKRRRSGEKSPEREIQEGDEYGRDG